MRAWIISDLHTSRLDLLHPRSLIVPQADICVCAGDVAENIERAIDFLHAEIAPHMTVVATLGNHDFYGSSIDRALEYARKWTAGTDVHVLENEAFERNDLRIIGATLWTDYEISAHAAGHLPIDARREVALRECSRVMRDFYEIRRSDERKEGEGGFVTATELIARHNASRTYIENELAEPFKGTSIVLTHHAPSARSLDPRFEGQVSNAAFSSDLTEIIRTSRPNMWVHGHIHRFSDYGERDTRVLCNPRGYHREVDTSGFRPGFVIETTVQGSEDANV
ncbi:metallophosphoesterase [Neorhizobium galegae]|uniref:metallophosphoesterase n=1 Tax=Neorhizobium galegae TaxID=399 RepID=UPI002102760B|nr:metallophosphoesterase [Neorhizobium galegae]MCQ1768066.1 metallophosphoesterase [Neorhizobium galegae]MCQ1848574.1 metallophosphoesterase [Neorhizobium galegae]